MKTYYNVLKTRRRNNIYVYAVVIPNTIKLITIDSLNPELSLFLIFILQEPFVILSANISYTPKDPPLA